MALFKKKQGIWDSIDQQPERVEIEPKPKKEPKLNLKNKDREKLKLKDSSTKPSRKYVKLDNSIKFSRGHDESPHKIVDNYYIQESKFKKFRKEKMFNKKGWIFAIISIVLAALIVIIPFAVVAGTGSEAISGSSSIYSNNGFVVSSSETDGVDEYTTFSVQHKETGKYLNVPTTYNSNLTLTDTQQFIFALEGDDFFGSDGEYLALRTNFYIDGEFLYVAPNEDGVPVFKKHSDGTESEFRVELHKNGSSQEYAFYFPSIDKFLGGPDENGVLQYSNEPEWFILEAEQTVINSQFITNNSEFYEEYWKYQGYSPTDIQYGINGTTFSLYSEDDNTYITSDPSKPEGYDTLGTSNTPSTNFFIPNQTGPEIQIGYFTNQTLEEDELPTNELIYSVLVATPDGTDVEAKPLEDIDGTAQEYRSQVVLERNPINLNEYAINFYHVGTGAYNTNYLNVEDGDIFLSDTPEYFTLNPAGRNVEDIYAYPTATTPNSGIYNITTNNPDGIYKVEMKASGYSMDDPTQTYETGWVSAKVTGTNNTLTFTQLPTNYVFDEVYMKVYRKDYGGDHVTEIQVLPFATIPWEIPEWEAPEDQPAYNTRIDEVEFTNFSDISGGLPQNTLKVEVDFVQGEGLDKVGELNVGAYPIVNGQTPDYTKKPPYTAQPITGYPEDGTYEFVISGLDPETEYEIVTIYDDEVMYDTVPSTPWDLIPDVYSYQTRTHRPIPVAISSGTYTTNGSTVDFTLEVTPYRLDQATSPSDVNADSLTVEIYRNGTLIETQSNPYAQNGDTWQITKQNYGHTDGDVYTYKIFVDMNGYGSEQPYLIPGYDHLQIGQGVINPV